MQYEYRSAIYRRNVTDVTDVCVVHSNRIAALAVSRHDDYCRSYAQYNVVITACWHGEIIC